MTRRCLQTLSILNRVNRLNCVMLVLFCLCHDEIYDKRTHDSSEFEQQQQQQQAHQENLFVNVKCLLTSTMEENNNSMDVSQHYASNFPYVPLDEDHLQHLINFTKGLNTSKNDSNTSLPYDCNQPAFFNIEFRVTLHVMYWTIFLIAILGNGMVCFIVCQSSRMQTVTNYFIANLAIADMCMAFLCIPFSFIQQLMQ